MRRGGDALVLIFILQPLQPDQAESKPVVAAHLDGGSGSAIPAAKGSLEKKTRSTGLCGIHY